MAQAAQSLTAPSTRNLGHGEAPPTDYRTWLTTLYPETYTRPLAPYHHEFWQWVWARRPDESATGVFIWPRGFSKTTNAERAVVKLASAGFRYILYVKGTQDASNDAVQNIGEILGDPLTERFYPLLADRDVTKFGTSKGWRHNRLRTAAGVIVDAAGLDTKTRGKLIEGRRPDVIVIDDVDESTDTLAITRKKLKRLTSDIIPAGAPNRVIMAVQNLILPHGIFTRLADVNPDYPADFMMDRMVSGPHPAVLGLETAMLTPERDGERPIWKITAGTSTWPEGRPIPMLEAEMNQMGRDSFIEEKQHEVLHHRGSLYEGFDLEKITLMDMPPLAAFEDIIVVCDPAVTATDASDSNGIRAGGRLPSGLVVGLYSWEGRDTVDGMLTRALVKAVELGASRVALETNQGGDTWVTAYDATWRALVEDPDHPSITAQTRKPRLEQVKASSATGGKRERWQVTLGARERGEFREARGTHRVLFSALERLPEHKPYDVADADSWLESLLRKKTWAVGGIMVNGEPT